MSSPQYEEDGDFVKPYDIDDNYIGYLGHITSDNKMVSVDIPMVWWGKIVVTSVTDNTLIIDKLLVTLDEIN